MQLLKPENAPYLLRWRFDFADRAAVFGMWNSSAISAWDKNREKLVRASIEAKSTVTHNTVTIAECDGHDFRNFQWLAISRVNPNFKGSVTPRSETIGLKILTTHDEVTVLISGECAARRLTDEEKGIHFATYGR
jgi:hypothetical protein